MSDSDYLTTHEAALAVVATAMKKARLRLDTLVINSFVGGMVFTSGGMLHVIVQSNSPELFAQNPAMVQLLQGIVYPIALFYVVILGADLFNLNILFFSVGVARNAVSVLDLLISWLVSYAFNLVGNIFVCYIICNYSGVTKEALFVKGSQEIVMTKVGFSFVETLIKGMAGNFFVCLAIYLQLMCKPLHVKFLMMLLPIFTFVVMGFTHAVADMYMLVIGLINHAPVSVGKVVWKVFLPGALGNIIGGLFFGLLIPWYLHIVVVERDQRLLHLPRYELRDEQPELNQDSRVVRGHVIDEDIDDKDSQEPEYGLEHMATRGTFASAQSRMRSPKNLFPVYGMGPPLERERSIALGIAAAESATTSRSPSEDVPSAEFLGGVVTRAFSRRTRGSDLESGSLAPSRRASSSTLRSQLRRFLFSSRNLAFRSNVEELNSRLSRAGVTPKAAGAANEVAGVADFQVQVPRMTPAAEELDTPGDSGVATPQDSSFRVVPYEPGEKNE